MLTYPVNPTLNNQMPTTRRNELFEDFFEVFRHLLECTLDGLIFALVENLHEFLDGVSGFIEVFSAPKQVVTLFCKVSVLFESFLVDMRILLERFVDVMKLLDQLNNVK